MTLETSAWAHAREKLAPFGKLHRIENRVAVGTPDAVYCLLTVTGLLETKATLESLKLEQVIFAEEWEAVGGLAHALLRADRTWFLLDAAGMRRSLEKREPRPLVRSADFPLKEVLFHLAPPARRVRPPRRFVAITGD